MNVARLLDYKDSIEKPVFVLVDLHAGILSAEDMAAPAVSMGLDRCKMALDHARRIALPIAFMRQCVRPHSMLENPSYPAWIRGFEPRRNDMVFDRTQPSCYSSQEFSRMIERTSRSFVLAGLSAEMSCISTMTAAYHLGHQVIYLDDASVCGSRWTFVSGDRRGAVSAILSLYGAVSDVGNWVGASARLAAG